MNENVGRTHRAIHRSLYKPEKTEERPEAARHTAKKALTAVCAIAAAVGVGLWVLPLAANLRGYYAIGGEWCAVLAAGWITGEIVWRAAARNK